MPQPAHAPSIDAERQIDVGERSCQLQGFTSALQMVSVFLGIIPGGQKKALADYKDRAGGLAAGYVFMFVFC